MAGIRVLLFISFLTIGSDLFGQAPEDKHSWSYGANGYYGALFRYREGTDVLNFTNPFGLEVYAQLQTTGSRLWQRQYKYPQIGFAATYYNYGVPAELGEAFTLTSYIGNTLINGPKSSLRFTVGTGFVYSTKYFKPDVNELNKAIGSKISFALRGNFLYEIALADQIYLNFNLAFRHFSNGGLNKPNNGMNFPLIGAGIRYQPHQVVLHSNDVEPATTDKGVHFNLKFAAGRKEVLYIDEKQSVFSISAYADKKLSGINAILLGADLIVDHSLKKEFINKGLPPPEDNMEPEMVAVTLGHELFMGRSSFLFQLGRYVYQPYGIFPSYYQRYGLKYLLTKNLSASAMLVAHAKTADFVEFGIGIHL